MAIATAGFHGDVLQLRRLLHSRMARYSFVYHAEMTADLASEMLARNLYYNRFFPLYTGVVMAGIDEAGKGCVFSYDPVGCIERLAYSTSGSAMPTLEPFFDAQIGWMTQDASVAPAPQLTIERAVAIMKDAFRMATEREIATGDKLQLVIIKAGQPPKTQYVDLRED